MCKQCPGLTDDELRSVIHSNIAEAGLSTMTHAPAAGEYYTLWAYTIGLTVSADHPELVVVGAYPELGRWAFSTLGHRICHHDERLQAGDRVNLGVGPSPLLLDVHPAHFARGTFPRWTDYFERLGPPVPEPRALQLLFDEDSCLRLDGPEDVLRLEARRRAARRRRPPRWRPGPEPRRR